MNQQPWTALEEDTVIYLQSSGNVYDTAVVTKSYYSRIITLVLCCCPLLVLWSCALLPPQLHSLCASRFPRTHNPYDTLAV